MTSASSEPAGMHAANRSRNGGLLKGGFWLSVLAVFGLQVGAIVWLGDRSRAEVRHPPAAPAYAYIGKWSGDLVAVEEPTLFVLPNPRGFSGAAWLQPRKLEYVRSNSFEPLRWLSPEVEAFGETFAQMVTSLASPKVQRIRMIEPTLTMPAVAPARAIVVPSNLRIEGDLAKHELRNPVELPAWRSSLLLTNTVLNVWVDNRGEVFSVRLVQRSGLNEADDFARRFANEALFEGPNISGAERIQPGIPQVSGTMIFQWQTLPVTNSSPVSPQP